jgi:aryl-alcohol dehydrogenase-like predicted oxidoreductase
MDYVRLGPARLEVSPIALGCTDYGRPDRARGPGS